MTGPDGYQVCLFPLTQLVITQKYGPNTYSHCCGCPLDYSTNGKPTPVYAPCDMHYVYRGSTGANTVFYSSDDLVHTPSGLSYVSIQLTHCRTQDLVIHNQIQQGQIIYYSGDASGSITSLGVHLHMDQSLYADAVWMDYHRICTGTKKDCWGMEHPAPAEDVFYVNDTYLGDTGGYDWKLYQGDSPDPPEPPGPPDPRPPTPGAGGNFKWWMAKLLLDKRRGR